jgi:cellulase/cellobiase CelA1
MPDTRSNQVMLKLRSFAARWKLLIIPVAAAAALAVVGVSVAIALPASASRGSSTFRTAAQATAGPGAGRTAAPGTGRPVALPRFGCLVRYTPTNWPGAFMAQVTISNSGRDSIHGWTLTFTFPGHEAISSAWNARFTQTGADVSARNMNYNATIRRGASQRLGFLGAVRPHDTHAAPTSFRVNGVVCG